MNLSRTITCIMLSCLPLAAWAAEPDDQERKAIAKIEGLLVAKKTSKAKKVATEHFGAPETWCDLGKVGDPTGTRTYGALAVLARRSKQHDVAARCAVASIFTSTTREAASAGFFELALVEPKLTDEQLAAVLDSSSECALFDLDLSDEFAGFGDVVEDGKKAEIAKARKAARAEIIQQAIDLWPTHGAVRQMKRLGLSPAKVVRDALAQDAPRAMVVRGPFASAKAAKKAMRREALMDRNKRKPVQPEKPVKAPTDGSWKVEMTRVLTEDGCDVNQFMALSRGDAHYYVPLGFGLYSVGDCGGYGAESELESVKWQVDQKLARGQLKVSSYINDSCGAATSGTSNDVFCDVTGHEPVCVQALSESRGLGGMGEGEKDLVYRFGSTAKVDAKGQLEFESSGPKPLGDALRKLGKMSVPEVAKALDPTLDAVGGVLRQE